MSRPETAVAELEKLLASPAYAEAAGRFAARYAGYDPVVANEGVVDAIDRIVRGARMACVT